MLLQVFGLHYINLIMSLLYNLSSYMTVSMIR